MPSGHWLWLWAKCWGVGIYGLPIPESDNSSLSDIYLRASNTIQDGSQHFLWIDPSNQQGPLQHNEVRPHSVPLSDKKAHDVKWITGAVAYYRIFMHTIPDTRDMNPF